MSRTPPRSRPAACARPSRLAATPRGTRHRRRSSSRTPTARYLCIPTAFVSWTGEALDHKIPLLRSMDALSKVAVRALKLFGDNDVHARLHDGRARAGVLPDRRAVLLRASRPLHDGPHAVRRQAAEGPRARRALLRLDPGARAGVHARDRARAASLGVPVKTRHNEVAPAQYELAPIFENSNVGSDHQQLTMQVMQNVARRYGLVCLLHEKPFAGVNGSGKHNNWSMGTDTGHNLLDPGDTPAGERAVPVLLRGRHRGRQQAPGAAARHGRERRPGPPPRRQRGAAGDHLDLPRPGARERVRRPSPPARPPRTCRRASSASAARCCRRCRCTAATATGPRRSPSRATSSSSARWARACRWASSTRCSTRSPPRRSTSSADKVEALQGRKGEASRRPSATVVKGVWKKRPRGSCSTATATRTRGTRRPRSAGC